MSSKNRAKHKRLSRRTTKQATAVPTTSSEETGMPSMFNNAQNMHITGGSFNNTTTINTSNERSLDILHKRVAPNAILNAGGRADEVKCHPGTREEVIGRIEKWEDAQDQQTAPIFWLSGPAGAGKSAIMQTIAERCKQRGLPHANFFFFRADTSRSHAAPLVATLLHQITLLYPSLRESVAAALSANPFLLDSVLEDQLMQLIVSPLRTVQQSSSANRPLILLIDGLDECDSETKRSQQQVLDAFDKILAVHPCPFRLLVASRDESQIRAAFNKLSSQCSYLYLDSQYSPERDIRIFVDAQFEQVRKTHPLAHTLNSEWPSAADVDFIVEKSSGQFIYVATVMRFILDSAASPILSLERVRGAAQLATKSPFSQLDAIYSYILAQADDQGAKKDILHAQVLIRKVGDVGHHYFPAPPAPPAWARFNPLAVPVRRRSPGSSSLRSSPLRLPSRSPFSPAPPWLSQLPPAPPSPAIPLMELLRLFNPNYTYPVILSCLADLTSIARYKSNSHQLLFYHASFYDYLLDHSRSGEYFVDIGASSYNIMPVIWNFINNGPCEKEWHWFAVIGTTLLQKLPPGSMNALSSEKDVWSYSGPQNVSFFKKISDLCISDDDFINFKRIVRQWIRRDNVSDFRPNDIKRIPFGLRYFQMARAEHFRSLDDEMAAAISPESDLDRQELGLWLSNLLHRIHREEYRSNPEYFKRLLRDWISWAIRIDIPCDSLTDLPNAQRYIRMSMAKKWPAHNLRTGRHKK